MFQWTCGALVLALILSDNDYFDFLMFQYHRVFPAGPAPVFKSGGNQDMAVNFCSNYIDVDKNDTTLGVFECPRESDPDEYYHCCGPRHAQICCPPKSHLSTEVTAGLLLVTTVLFASSLAYTCQSYTTHKSKT